ncbi:MULTISPECIES: hypothetical protein [Ralstonia solanacearum species complex]|uniref:Uncharacterized protein n=1 Tax=Ralstonia nicotianae TaxID=3037696 RepID=A0ABX7ZPK4_9RALS|nr:MULTISPECIES: hypothetical protein [Ralstonia solanacearum species complex]QIK17194.1 hypothetical protein G7968_01475 [Ralstonia solanacearum]MCK4123257.1 hypothetical protein [Ralstonia pseudosolanacearum]MCK4138002.1 hypothetical protein [Ralstonia pseudosolanacearum]MCK4148692.1 hypothetical protein [Ralstonia pseudosolanacearum]MCK4153605.1 hypothetical protein [Ralstonia pseudosolanacearum]
MARTRARAIRMAAGGTRISAALADGVAGLSALPRRPGLSPREREVGVLPGRPVRHRDRGQVRP